jgi:hypothetical protein
MHQATVRQVIILDRPMLHGAIVPQQQIARPPLVPIDEGRLHDMLGERRDQGLGFLSLDALDPGTVVAHDVQAFASGIGMRPDDRMGDRRVAVDFRLLGRKRALAAGEIEHRTPTLDPPAQRLWQGIPGRGGTGKFGIAQAQADRSGISRA